MHTLNAKRMFSFEVFSFEFSTSRLKKQLRIAIEFVLSIFLLFHRTNGKYSTKGRDCCEISFMKLGKTATKA